ncbi:MAG: Pyruvate ferredoxin/flavodoxin oxidoreductase, beta subunit [Parcubacteria group bacterium GW2011_GWA2_47_7]|nr:MAG: Pyruvate ferredoxin/flavodoxin oxidoreductase, beta subunit [Parcubacteria group bacterium GW2011_GWA2_47_7]
MELATHSKISWCPGCPNNQILVAFRKAVTEMCEAGTLKEENIVASAGVGCHAKILDYLNMNTFNALHGRSIPPIEGMKAANPSLTVVAFSGDGDSYSEGLSHLIHSAQRNSDINVFIHDNQIFALTTGQATATSPKGFKGLTRPTGSIEDPIDPLRMMMNAGATFVARTYAGEMGKTKDIMKAAMAHKGMSFIDIAQPCITFFDTRDFYKDNIAWLPEDHDVTNLDAAYHATKQSDGKIPMGIFYQVLKPTFEEQL